MRKADTLLRTMKLIANGRAPCPSGDKRISRDDLKTMARDCLRSIGEDWRSVSERFDDRTNLPGGSPVA